MDNSIKIGSSTTNQDVILNLEALSPKQSKLLDEQCGQVIKFINSFSSTLIESSKSELATLFSILASRHSYQNKLFIRLNKLLLVKTLLENGEDFSTIEVKDKKLALTIGYFLKQQNIQINIVTPSPSWIKKIKGFAKPFVNIHTIFNVGLKMRLAKSTKRLKSLKGLHDMILIDTYLLQASLDQRRYIDRYYTGLIQTIPANLKSKVLFLPTILGRYSKTLLSQVSANSEEPLIYKEDLLSTRDYMKALLALSKLERPVDYPNFQGITIKLLVDDEYRRTKYSPSSFHAHLNYAFIKRLRSTSMTIKHFINWNENQVIDKALIRGFKDFFPSTKVSGYQGFITSPDFHFYIPPTACEIENRIIADQIAVIGKGLIESQKRFTKDIDVIVAPAFRQTYNTVKPDQKHIKNSVLVLLPIGIDESIQILSMLQETLPKVKNFNAKVNVKLHPATNKNSLLAVATDLLINVKIVEDEFLSIVSQQDLMISNATSAIVEAISLGTPTVIIANNSGITQNPVPLSVDKKIWTVAYDANDLQKAFVHYLSMGQEERNELSIIGKRVQVDFFEKVTREAAATFLS